jgi:thioredoxin 1
MKKVLKFSASWCGPCKMLSKTLEDVKTDVIIEEIDIDEQSELANEYGIRGVPTLVMVDENVEIKRNVGNLTKSQLEIWLND